jgi:hypothetical protein
MQILVPAATAAAGAGRIIVDRTRLVKMGCLAEPKA